MQQLRINERFTLVFKVKKSNLKKVSELLYENKLEHADWQKCTFDGFVEIRVDVNLRRAELIRQLLKNIETYD